MSSAEGFLLIADITGYTRYLSQSELEHAKEILGTLLELLVSHTRPPLVLFKLEGDAVMSYGLRERFFQGQTFIEMLEETYIAFRRAIELMVRNNTCRCNACANVNDLDLKFFVHYGAFAIQRISSRDELMGSDVNLIYRLLKNHVVEGTGIQAYTLYTQAAIDNLGMPEFLGSLAPFAEHYEHLGEVQVWVQDMHPAWQQKRSAARIVIPPETVVAQVEIDIHLPPEQVWDYLIQPEYRKILLASDRQAVIHRSHGRIGPGSVYQCFHGDKLVAETILEWQPFERIITQDLMPIPFPNTTVLVEYRLSPIASGTRLAQSFTRARGPWAGRLLTNLIMKRSIQRGTKDLEAFKQRIELAAAEVFTPEEKSLT